MSILDKFFKKRKNKDNFKIVIQTNKKLSKEIQSIIFDVVKKGIDSNLDFKDIAINIMVNTGIYETIVITDIKNGVKVIF